MAANFGTIRPGDIDNFVFDFTKQIGSSGNITTTPSWTCVVSPDSVYLDTTPQDRLIGTPSYDDYKTGHQAGLMLDGVTYTFTVIVTIDDGRVFSAVSEVECTDADTLPVAGTYPLTVEQFRSDFPEFSDASKYSNDSIQMWIDYIISDNQFPIHRWGTLQLLGQELYIAHQIALGAWSGMPGIGGIPGLGFSGIANSRSVNGVSVSYDTTLGTDADMGEYALTLYGRRLWTMMMNAGAGPVQF